MNALNRILVILLLLAIILATTVIAIVPLDSLRFVSQLSEGLRLRAGELDWAVFAAGRVLIGGAIVIVCLVLLWLELRRPRKKTIRAQKLEGGESHIAIESIAQRLSFNIDQLPDVVNVSPRITGKSRGVDVDLLLETSPDIDIPMKTEEVMQVTREVVVERMGLKLGKVQVKIKHAPYPRE